jgi:hypothetical protein
MDIDKSDQSWWGALRRIRANLEASGTTFMTDGQVAAHIASLREADRADELVFQSSQRPPEKSDQ